MTDCDDAQIHFHCPGWLVGRIGSIGPWGGVCCPIGQIGNVGAFSRVVVVVVAVAGGG